MSFANNSGRSGSGASWGNKPYNQVGDRIQANYVITDRMDILSNLNVGNSINATGQIRTYDKFLGPEANIDTINATDLNVVTFNPASLSVSGTTESTTTSTGSIITAGGAGIAKNLNVGGSASVAGAIAQADTTQSTNPTTGAIVTAGGFGCAKNLRCGGSGAFTGSLSTNSTTESTDTGTGSITTLGGIGCVKNLNVGAAITCGDFTSTNMNTTNANAESLAVDDTLVVYGLTQVTNLISLDTSESTAISNGAIVTHGGIGCYKNLTVGGAVAVQSSVYVADTTDSSSTSTGALRLLGGFGCAKNITAGGSLHVNSTTLASSTTAGSITTPGGIWCDRNLVVGATLQSTSTADASTNPAIPSAAIQTDGGIACAKGLTAGGLVTFTGVLAASNTTESTSTTTGAVKCAGGIGCVKNLNVGGNAVIDGTLTATGGIAQGTWYNVSYAATFTNYGAPHSNVQYMKDQMGFVHIRGLCYGGLTQAAAQTIFTLPVGYRPPATLMMPAVMQSAGAVAKPVEIDSSGNVTVENHINGWLSLTFPPFSTI